MRILLSGLLTTLLFISCGQNDKSAPATDKKETNAAVTSADGNEISFKADGDKVSSEGWVVQRFVWDDKTPAPWLNIVSNMHKDKRSININLNAAKTGTYSFAEQAPIMSSSHGSYHPDYFDMTNSYSFISGEVAISEIDTVKGIVNGSFAVIAKNTEGKTITITDGIFNNLRLKPGITNISGGLK